MQIENSSQIATASVAHGLTLDRAAVAAVEKLKAFIAQTRTLKAEHNVASRRDVKLMVIAADAEWTILAANLAKLTRLAGAAEITRREKVDGAPAAVTPARHRLPGSLRAPSMSAPRKSALRRNSIKSRSTSSAPRRGLSNEAFVSKAPPAVLEGARKQLADQKAKRAELERLLKGLG